MDHLSDGFGGRIVRNVSAILWRVPRRELGSSQPPRRSGSDFSTYASFNHNGRKADIRCITDKRPVSEKKEDGRINIKQNIQWTFAH
jgi:hypothetical protein